MTRYKMVTPQEMRNIQHLRGYLENIPATTEQITPDMIDQMIALTETQLAGLAKLPGHSAHHSKALVHDDHFSNLAFSDPATWQLHAFEKEFEPTREGYYMVNTGYLFRDTKQFPIWWTIRAPYVYRVIFTILTTELIYGRVHQFSPWTLNIRERPNVKPELLPDWEVLYYHQCVLKTTQYTEPKKVDYELAARGNVQVTRDTTEFLMFLRALKPFITEPTEYTFNIRNMIHI
jgi:hypothetical protein